jgi:phosphoenolpyruvate carboxylase
MIKMTYLNPETARDKAFDTNVALKYQIYNGMFLGLPFKDVDQAGAQLSIFTHYCEDGLLKGQNPQQIVESYLAHINIPQERQDELLFKFLQFIERQVVLFDALEDAAFYQVTDLSGVGTLNYLTNQIRESDPEIERIFMQTLNDYKIRVVLTAHPTQFYPNHILAIILQLGDAIRKNDFADMRNLFLQMGLTRFSNKTKPTPLDEATSLIWYLENMFYANLAKIQGKLPSNTTNLELGFWPGGDRDGNPNVTYVTTLAVARKLRKAIIGLYYKELSDLQYRLTFDGVYDQVRMTLAKIEQDEYTASAELIVDLELIIERLDRDYHGLFTNPIALLIKKVRMFNFYFAKLDIRQNSHVHEDVIASIFKEHNICEDYLALTSIARIELLKANLNRHELLEVDSKNSLTHEIINTIKTIHTIQTENGTNAIERYIISNTQTAANIFEVLFLISIYNSYLKQYNTSFGQVSRADLIKIEITPLFETITDLHNAPSVMEFLYQDAIYREHLIYNHNNRQTIMLGFSDGTKDGGYLMANWSIYQAKKQLTKLSRKYGISVVFFDGRGGPPARGGGNTNDFYRSLGKNIESRELQLTVQGQTISSNFGTTESATFNLEQLFTAGIIGRLFPDKTEGVSSDQEKLIEELAEISYEYYLELRNDPLFVPYLEEITPLKYLSETNFGSRPAKRNVDSGLRFEDLRAIPFVGAWTQMKQNILGFYGVGYAIKAMIAKDPYAEDRLRHLYADSLFFRALINNSMQSLAKSNFVITAYLANDPKYGKFWLKLKEEADCTRDMLLCISVQDELLKMDPSRLESINLREKIILPLLMIQQYAMMKLRSGGESKAIFDALIKKSLAANINANRNSV